MSSESASSDHPFKNYVNLKAMRIGYLEQFPAAFNETLHESGVKIGNRDLLFLTSFGMVIVPADHWENESAFEAILNSIEDKIVEDLNELSEPKLVGNGSYIILNKVTVITWAVPNNRYHLDELVLFTDSIQGVSFGNMTINEG